MYCARLSSTLDYVAAPRHMNPYPLAAGQCETQGIAQSIHIDMNFRTEAAPAASQCLGVLSTVLFQGTGSARVSTDDGTVNKQMLHIWVIDEMLI